MREQLAAFLSALRTSAADRFFPQPLDSVDALGAFVGQRAAYVAQTALYGYLKTRMGTRFPEYFSNETFAASIKAAAVRVFASNAADLSIHATALAAREGGLDDAATAALARACFARALACGVDPADAALLPTDARAAFAVRTAGTDWARAAEGSAAFAGSADDLIRFAPVIDEFKKLDREIVRNSVRFRWVNVRDQLSRRLVAEAVCADWRRRSGS